jgi:hypothetical protein
MLGEPEVRQLEGLPLQQDVLRLQVHVRDVLRAQELQGERQLEPI